jgi:hypothetical protein
MDSDIFVCLHGYHQMQGGKDTETVMRDRLAGARRVADAYADLGAVVKLLFLGGHGDKAEEQAADHAHPMRAYAAEVDPQLLETYDHDIADHRCGNTRAELVSVAEYLKDHESDPSFVVSVSSKDHVPRIQRLWAELQNTGIAEDAYIASAVASEGTYAQNGLLPFILEAARFESFIVPFNELWNIAPDQHEEAAREVGEVLKRYH